MSEITPSTIMIHRPSPIFLVAVAAIPHAVSAARLSHYKFLVTIIIGQCIITSTSPQCSLFYMPAVLFVLSKHRHKALRRAPTTAGRRAPAPPAPEQGAPSICAPIPDAHDLVVRIIHSIVFPHPITARTLPTLSFCCHTPCFNQPSHPLFISVLLGTHIGCMTDCAD